MRTFAPLTEEALAVPAPLLDALIDAFGAPGSWVVIGARALDLALHVGEVKLPRRTTLDVDVAVAARTVEDFDRTLGGVGQPEAAWQRRHVLGQQVDVVPFGDVEMDGRVKVRDMVWNALGLAEAAEHADHLMMPSGRILPVAPLELIAVLKLLAFADRYPAQTKDADDLNLVLQAASRGCYGEEVWDDDAALAAGDYDHEVAAAYRLGRRGRSCFAPDRARLLLSVVDSTEERFAFSRRNARPDLWTAWLKGIRDEPMKA